MNKINFANIILVGAVVFLLGGISQVYAVPAAPNKTNITAEISSVQQIDSSSNFASNYVKILEIKVIKYESVEGAFSVPSELKAYVHKWTNDLAIVNKLEKGQIITATISYSGDERGGMWDIREIKIFTYPSAPNAPMGVPARPMSWFERLFTGGIRGDEWSHFYVPPILFIPASIALVGFFGMILYLYIKIKNLRKRNAENISNNAVDKNLISIKRFRRILIIFGLLFGLLCVYVIFTLFIILTR